MQERILGLDPGSRYTGYGVIDRRGSRLRPVVYGRISLPRREALAVRLARLARELSELVQRYEPTTAVLEALYGGVNARSLIVLSQARGVLLAVVATEGLEIEEYSPAEVKTAVTGYGRADKDQVAFMVRRILGLGREPIENDASDALAVAICYAQRSKMDRLSGRSGARSS